MIAAMSVFRLRLLLLGFCAASLLILLATSCKAGGMSLSAAPEVVLADGRSTTTLTATVRDLNGAIAADGTSVRFTTSLGTLDHDTTTVQAGAARVILTSASSPGTANITATAFGGVGGSASGVMQVEFTSERDAAGIDGDARWVHLDCAEYLVYSADSKILEADGKHGSAHLQYRGLTIAADSLQLNLQSLLLLGRNATLTRGKHTAQAIELRYDLNSGTGTAVVLGGLHKNRPQSVNLTGYGFTQTPQSTDDAQAAVDGNVYRFTDISGSQVVVSARAVSVQPGDRIQFRRAAIYSDGKKILTVPFHVMSTSSNQLFGQQLVGFGSQGLFLNVPVYYHVDPHSTGTLYVRNSAAGGADTGGLPSSTLGRSGTRPGIALDLEHSYSFGRGSSGQLALDGLTRSDWGAHWNHAQRIDDQTSSYLYLDYPSHRSLYGSSSVSRSLRDFNLNLSATGSRDPGYGGYASSSATLSASLQTVARAIGRSGVNWTTGVSMQRGRVTQTTPDGPTTATPISTRSLDFRFFTAPLHPDKHTSVTDSVTVGQSWNDTGRHSLTVLGVASLARRTAGNGNLAVNYTFRYDPLLSQLSAYSARSSLGGGFLGGSMQQRVALSYFLSPRPRLNFGLISSFGLPLNDQSLVGTMDYRFNDDWGLSLSSAWDRYGDARYQDTEVSVLRRILGRDLVFTYSTQTHRVLFDLAASGL